MNDGRTVITQYRTDGELHEEREAALEERARRWSYTDLEWIEADHAGARGGTLRRLVGRPASG